MANTPATTVRFSPQELAVLDAWATALDTNRTDVLRSWIRRVPAPETLGPAWAELRRAKAALSNG